jgi:hypothetical protein
VDDPTEVGVGGERPPGPQLRDLRVDVRHPPLTGDGHPVVPVDDEVRLTELVHLDRREVSLGERLLHATPTLLHTAAPGEEVRSNSPTRSTEPTILATSIVMTPR